MTEPARLEQTDHGLVPASDGWFVINARDASWLHAPGRSAYSDFEFEQPFQQLGISIAVLEPGQPMAMYHWEADQEDFLVLAGEAVLVIEGEERPLTAWDFVHCPPGTGHVIIGAGTGNCVLVAVGAREHEDQPDWGGYPVNEVAARRDASAATDTSVPGEAYAGLPRRKPVPYRDGWLPELR